MHYYHLAIIAVNVNTKEPESLLKHFEKAATPPEEARLRDEKMDKAGMEELKAIFGLKAKGKKNDKI